jgi:hypothetical protein
MQVFLQMKTLQEYQRPAVFALVMSKQQHGANINYWQLTNENLKLPKHA